MVREDSRRGTAGREDPVLSALREAAAMYLWRMGAVRVDNEEPFELASGNHSPIYVNCRRAISEPSFLRLYVATACLTLERSGVAPQVVAGGETAGIPYAAYLAGALSLPMIYVRKKAKEHGLGSRVEGYLEKRSRVLLVEDLITDGGSKVGFLEAIAEAGGEVADALVLFDRQQGGGELLASRGVHLHTITDLASTLAAGKRAGLLAASDLASVEAYFADTEGWHLKRGLAFQK